MTYATDVFAGDGSTTEFTLTFDFIQRDHVKVYRVVTATEAETELSVITSGDPSGDEFIWESDSQVKVGTAPTADQQIKVARETPEDEQIVTWQDGSYIIAADLNQADLQFLYGIQELEDKLEEIDGSVTGEAVKKVTGTAPISVDSTNSQKPAISVDTIKKADAESDPTDPSWDTDDKLPTAAAVDRVYKQVVGDGVGFPGDGNKAKLGQLRIDDTGDKPKILYWDAGLATPAWVEVSQAGPTGPKGDTGDTGPAPGLQDPATSVSNVVLNADGSVGTATATVSQDDDKNLKFTFGIPVGQRGLKGDTGSGVTYKGLIAAATADEPADPENGDFYVSTDSGASAWAGEVVEGTRIVWNAGTDQWDTFDPVASQTLQAVCDLGNFTTTDVAIGYTAASPKIELKNGGTAIFDGLVESKNDGFKFPDGTTQTTAVTAPATSTLQEVTDAGNFTDNDIDIGGTSDSPNIQLEATGAAIFGGRLEANQGSFNGDVGIIGESGTDTAFFIRDDGDDDKTTFSVQADGDVDTKGAITAAGDIYTADSFQLGTSTNRSWKIDRTDGNWLESTLNINELSSDSTAYPRLTIEGKGATDSLATFDGSIEAAGTGLFGKGKSGEAISANDAFSIETDDDSGKSRGITIYGNSDIPSTNEAFSIRHDGDQVVQVNYDGSITAGAIESAAEGVPLTVNSTNDNAYKIQFDDSGTTRGFVGAEDGVAFKVGNSSATKLIDVKEDGEIEAIASYSGTDANLTGGVTADDFLYAKGNCAVGNGASTSSSIALNVVSNEKLGGIWVDIDRGNATYAVQARAKGGTQTQYGIYGYVETSSSYSSGGGLFYSINQNTYTIAGYWSGTTYWGIYSNGQVGGTGFPDTSDERLKNISGKVENVLDKLGNINTYYYTWKDNTQSGRSADGSTNIGVSAQEVQAQFPEVVVSSKHPKVTGENPTTMEEELGETLSVDYGKISSILIQAVKELREENKALQERISVLESSN